METAGVLDTGPAGSTLHSPGRKVEVIGLSAKLSNKISRQSRKLAPRDLIRYTEEIRSTYLDIRDGLRLPPLICNPDGDPVLFHTLTSGLDRHRLPSMRLPRWPGGIPKLRLLDPLLRHPLEIRNRNAVVRERPDFGVDFRAEAVSEFEQKA